MDRRQNTERFSTFIFRFNIFLRIPEYARIFERQFSTSEGYPLGVACSWFEICQPFATRVLKAWKRGKLEQEKTTKKLSAELFGKSFMFWHQYGAQYHIIVENHILEFEITLDGKRS